MDNINDGSYMDNINMVFLTVKHNFVLYWK
jgi:hypothetical protein